MKRTGIGMVGITLTMVMIMVMMAGCSDGGGGNQGGGDAFLDSLTVAGVSPENIPAAITPAEWSNPEVFLSALDGAVEYIYLPNTGAFQNAAINVNASSGANVAYAVGFDVDRGDISFSSGATRTFEAYQYLFVRVTNSGTVNYYAFQIQPVSGNASLNTLTVANVTASLGIAAATWDAAEAGNVGISNSNKDSATVVATSNNQATVKYAKVTGDSAPTFDTTATLSFEDGDFLYIEVTAADGETVLIYKIEIQIGHNTELETFMIAGVDVRENMGTPGPAWNEVEEDGAFDYQEFDVPSSGIIQVPMEINPIDPDAAIEYALVADGKTEPTSFTPLPSTPPALPLTNGQYLYVKVTSGNGKIKEVYKLRITMKNSIDVLYGQPAINKNVSGGVPTLDALWDTVDWNFDVSRVNLNEMRPSFRFLNTVDGHYNDTGYGHTEGKAKAFWDDYGLYIYAEMTYHDYYNNATDFASGTVKERVTIKTEDGVENSSNHLRDSLEIFVNERLQQFTSGNNGVQFRVAPSTAAGKSVISGDSSIAGAVEEFRVSDKYYTWVRSSGGKELGYSVLAHVPWMAKTDVNAGQVFGADGKVKAGTDSGPKIGAELQLNTVTTSGSRDSILTWNGVNGQSYQQVRNYGILNLITGDLSARGITRGEKDAKVESVTIDTPTINVALGYPTILTTTVQPKTAVDQRVTWSSANTNIATINSATGMVIGVATGTATITATTVDGGKTATCQVTVFQYNEPTGWEEKITTVVTSVPVYGFNIPANKTFGDYDRLIVKIKMDAGTPNTTGRLRAWGSYALSSFTFGSTPTRPSMGNTAGDKLLTNPGLDSFSQTADEGWKEYELPLNAIEATNQLGLTGIVTIGFGIIPPGGGSGNRIFFVKDIVLSNEAKTELVPAMYPKHPGLWGDAGASAYVTQDSGAGNRTERELQ